MVRVLVILEGCYPCDPDRGQYVTVLPGASFQDVCMAINANGAMDETGKFWFPPSRILKLELIETAQ